MSLVEICSNDKKDLSQEDPHKGLCPDYCTCHNYMAESYDCSKMRNMGLNKKTKRFPCYRERV